MNKVIVVAGQEDIPVWINADSACIGDWRSGRTRCGDASVTRRILLIEQPVPPPATRVMIPESGLTTGSPLLMSSFTSTLPNGSVASPLKAPTPKMPLTARQPSPYASVGTTPVERFAHWVPVVAAIGDEPSVVVMVDGNATGDWVASHCTASQHTTRMRVNGTRRMEESPKESLRIIGAIKLAT